MEKDYTDVNNTSIAEYTVLLRQIENNILESLRKKDLRKLKSNIKLYFKLQKLLDKKTNIVSKENSKSRG